MSPAPLVAQDRDLLPMTYVKVDARVARRLAADWERLRDRGAKWVYCVTGWSFELSQDRDTIFLITAVRSAPASRQAHEATGFSCPDSLGEALPIVHAHPGGDCSASRTDAANAVAHFVPFGLILCGKRSTAGYSRTQFLLMIKGALYDRNVGAAPREQRRR